MSAGPTSRRAGSPGEIMARIIVVEEDSQIRALVAEWLRGAGHAVAVCDRLDAMPRDEGDLVIVDVVEPRRGGARTLRAAHAARPGTPLVAISGQFTASIGSSSACGLGVRRLIGKPFTRDQLLRVVGDVLRNL